jgi:hypothetical protein
VVFVGVEHQLFGVSGVRLSDDVSGEFRSLFVDESREVRRVADFQNLICVINSGHDVIGGFAGLSLKTSPDHSPE